MEGTLRVHPLTADASGHSQPISPKRGEGSKNHTLFYQPTFNDEEVMIRIRSLRHLFGGLLFVTTLLLTQNFPMLAQETSPVSFKQTASPASTYGFRIDVDIYTDESKPPVAQFKTLFTETQTIEIDTRGDRVTVLDYTDGTLSALNTAKRTLTIVELATIETMVKELLAQVGESKITARREADHNGAGAMSVFFDDNSVTYQTFIKKPPVPVMAVRYGEFADATTKLAAVFPPYKPPQLRLRLNEHLRDANLLPIETKRIANVNGVSEVVTARLLIKERFDAEDKKDLQIIGDRMAQFQLVRANEFFEVK